MGKTRRRPLRDDAVIVRYGLMDVGYLRVATQRCKEVRGSYGLSFFGENDLTLEEIVTAAPRPHGWLRVSTYGRMRKAGFRPRRAGSHNHLVLSFDGCPTEDVLRRLVGVFDPPIPNPHPV